MPRKSAPTFIDKYLDVCCGPGTSQRDVRRYSAYLTRMWGDLLAGVPELCGAAAAATVRKVLYGPASLRGVPMRDVATLLTCILIYTDEHTHNPLALDLVRFDRTTLSALVCSLSAHLHTKLHARPRSRKPC